jgi:hypothetical protein
MRNDVEIARDSPWYRYAILVAAASSERNQEKQALVN